MNDIPNRDGRSDKVGVETEHAHRLLCRLRDNGATEEDLITMCAAPAANFEAFIAMIRGTVCPPTGDMDWRLVNLDMALDPIKYQAENLNPLRDVSIKIINDRRLGIWYWYRREKLKIAEANAEVRLMSPFDPFLKNGHFEEPSLLKIPGTDNLKYCSEMRLLNAAAAQWISQCPGLAEELFNSLPKDCPACPERIFFPGTVWKIRHGNVISPVLTLTGSMAHRRIDVLPATWGPRDYIAVLLPNQN
jgi:hypothetical protein